MKHRLQTVIAIGNQKGGVGKTTNTVHLAAALGERGYRCLILDLDPAAGATKHLGVPLQSFAGTLELLTTDEAPQALVLTKRLPKHVHLIPSRPQLAELDNVLSKFDDKTQILERSLALARPDYDFILLDTPPSAGATTTVAAYCSADWFLLSVFPHPLSLAGLNEAVKDIADVRRRRNPALEILGVILTCVDTRTKMAAELEAIIAQSLPGRAFLTFVTQAVALPECSGRGKTLFQSPALAHHKVTHQYRRLAAEIEHRVIHREAFLTGMLASPDLTHLVMASEESLTPDEGDGEDRDDAESVAAQP